MSNYLVYVLINTNNNKTYVGITNNYNRRIRQHNSELVGGAKYTTNNKNNGIWCYYGIINNLDKRISLRIEKLIKINSKKMSGLPIERRIKSINKVLINYPDLIFEYII
jgi:putative endonuclease